MFYHSSHWIYEITEIYKKSLFTSFSSSKKIHFLSKHRRPRSWLWNIDNEMTYCDNRTMGHIVTMGPWHGTHWWWGGGDADADKDMSTQIGERVGSRLWHSKSKIMAQQDGEIMAQSKFIADYGTESNQDDMLWWGGALSDCFTALLSFSYVMITCIVGWHVVRRWGKSLEDIYIKAHIGELCLHFEIGNHRRSKTSTRNRMLWICDLLSCITAFLTALPNRGYNALDCSSTLWSRAHMSFLQCNDCQASCWVSSMRNGLSSMCIVQQEVDDWTRSTCIS